MAMLFDLGFLEIKVLGLHFCSKVPCDAGSKLENDENGQTVTCEEQSCAF